jgi:hypothetical protein
MTGAITGQNLIVELMKSFPELEATYKQEVAASGEQQLSNYEVVGFIFKPRFKSELETGTITEFLRRSARFIESVCKSADAEAVNVIWIKLFEWLLVHPLELRLLWAELGPATKATVRDAATRWNSLEALPE